MEPGGAGSHLRGTALITGASRGIGRGVALELARCGYDIAGVATRADPSHTETGLYEVKARVEALGRRFLPLAGDVADLACHERLVTETLAAFPRIDVFVSNAGVAPLERRDVLETTPESFDRVLGVNLRGAFFFAQRVAGELAMQSPVEAPTGGLLVFITSVSAEAASPNRAEYCISKAGLSMAARNFAVRLAPHGIRVFEVRPGIIATDMTAGVAPRYEALMKGGLLLQPRWGLPEDVGRAVAGLALGYFDYSTGTVIEVGGGFGVPRL